MKLLVCGLIAVVSLTLTSAVLAASAEEGQITGTVVEVDSYGCEIVIETADKKRWPMCNDSGYGYDKPKSALVGQKVTVHYWISKRGKCIAYKIEKAGKADKGAKKHTKAAASVSASPGR
jgi:hypothetical protein